MVRLHDRGRRRLGVRGYGDNGEKDFSGGYSSPPLTNRLSKYWITESRIFQVDLAYKEVRIERVCSS